MAATEAERDAAWQAHLDASTTAAAQQAAEAEHTVRESLEAMLATARTEASDAAARAAALEAQLREGFTAGAGDDVATLQQRLDAAVAEVDVLRQQVIRDTCDDAGNQRDCLKVPSEGGLSALMYR